MSEFLKRALTGIIYAALLIGSHLYSFSIYSILLLFVLGYILIFEWPQLVIGQPKYFWVVTIFYPVMPVLALIFLNYSYRSYSLILPLYPYFASWVCDVNGLIIGKWIGKYKICPKISPGKSWEGLMAGFLGILILNIFLYNYLTILSGMSLLLLISFSLLLAVMDFFGDIFISYLKRKVGLKDTGKILPGHGGLLDRFDSVFFTVFVVLGVIYFRI
ncbi:phosphatidate cytidylyltransferase [Candidatus Babeliales bacterium]|nr:phosphatidate cytidylyltransferase [Candidatus Babeliales bacterium]